MELGSTLREIRRSQGVTLQQVADGSDLSKSFVSQIESGAANPSISSLKRIADVLGVPLAALFNSVEPPEATEDGGSRLSGQSEKTAREEVRVVRRDRRKMIAWPGAEGETFLLTPDLQRKLEVIESVMQPGDERGIDEPYSHEGEECGIVLEGRYEVTVGDETFVLEVGDSIYYPSHLPHKTRVLGDEPVKTIWIITPPSF